MAFDINIRDLVVLVVDKEHPRYCQIGKMLYHNWSDCGEIGVKFPDGKSEEFYDGMIKGDPPSKIKRYYRLLDCKGMKFDSKGGGPASFQKEFLKHSGNLESLAKQYKTLFNADLPHKYQIILNKLSCFLTANK